jgi:monofunctional biosynthetic peptidoglycan transglycosylase
VFGLVVVAAGALLASLPDVKALAKAPPKSTAFIDLRRAQAAEAKRRFALRWVWRPLAEISPHLRHAVVITEDAKFWDHEGVDWDAVEAAAERNWEKGRFALGGSTITQQLAKNLYLSPSKNPVRKLRELLIARRLEAELSKERLLELYLNVVEWGDGIFGAEAAARFWFGRPARELNPTEAARLALALPNPRQRSPKVRSSYLDRRAAGLLRIMWRQGVLSEEAYQSALPGLGVAPPAAPSVSPAAPAAPPAFPPPSEDELMPPSGDGDAGAI